MANMNSKTKVVTGINTRLSYFHGWEPVSINGGAEKYSVSVLIPKDDTATVNAVNAAIDELRSGEGREFRACADRRLTVLEDPQIRDAKLEPFPAAPWLLYYADISEDPGEWINVSMAAYYGKDSVAFPGY